jgi:hypothetical protein
MWASAYNGEKFNSGFTFVDMQEVRCAGGKYYHTGTRYGEFPIIFIPDDSMNRMRNTEGNIVVGMGNAVVPSWWFVSGGITPQLDDFIVTPDNIEYRIVGIDNFVRHTPAGVYYLFLRRDQIDYGR